MAVPTSAIGLVGPSASRSTSPAVEGEAAPVVLGPDAGVILLRLARAAVVAAATGQARSLADVLPAEPPDELLAPAAAFVTLHQHGELRGCIGSLATDRPLWRNVLSAAIGAAVDDPRFAPLRADDVPSVSIDVSVLGPATLLRDPAAFEPGMHGTIVERGGRRGLLLPEVATDQGWGLRSMLECTCRKAGLPVDAWREPGTSVYLFRTSRVSEEGAGTPRP
jgi:AmmeMemoRadiSam system protein A